MKARIQMAKSKLKQMLRWSDRLGSDEIIETNEVIKLLDTSEIYTIQQMEASFIAGGKLCRDIKNDGFEEFLKKL